MEGAIALGIIAIAVAALAAFRRHYALPAGGQVPALPSPKIDTIGMTARAPAWCFGHRDPESWLFASDVGRTPLVVIALSDPYQGERDDVQAKHVEAACFTLADALRMQTDLPTRVAVMAAISERKIVRSSSRQNYESLAGYVEKMVPRPILVWGHARQDLATDGVTLKIRHPERATERTLSAPLADVADFLIAWLVDEDLCTRRDPPAWYAPVIGGAADAYAELVDSLTLQAAASPRMARIDPLDGDHHRSLVLDALVAADAHDHPVIHLCALAVACYVSEAGHLNEAARERAVALVARYSGDHPVYRLSPSIFARLGIVAEFEQRLATLRGADQSAFRASGDPYQQWLDRVVAARPALGRPIT